MEQLTNIEKEKFMNDFTAACMGLTALIIFGLDWMKNRGWI